MANTEAGIGKTRETSSAPAAYLPFKTFLSAIDALQHGLPKKLDRTIWRSQSGVTQSQIMMALRFFSLIDEEDRPTPALVRLVENTDKRPEMVGSLLQHSYRDLLNHDLTKMTPRMLADAMEAYNVSGDTKRKAVGFFLRAAQFANIPMHPLLSSTMRNSSGPRRKRTAKPKGHFVGEMNGATDNTYEPRPSANSRTVSLSTGGKVTLTIDANVFMLAGEDRDFVFKLIDQLSQYQNAHPAEPEEADEE